MEEHFELLEHIYEDSEMACFTLKEVIEELKEKDNKIKRLLEDIYQEYSVWEKESLKKLKENQQETKETSRMAKKMAKMGIQKEIKSDNSDSSIADLLIQGISMGSIDMEKKIKAYQEEISKEQFQFAEDFLKFQQKAIRSLKEYL